VHGFSNLETEQITAEMRDVLITEQIPAHIGCGTQSRIAPPDSHSYRIVSLLRRGEQGQEQLVKRVVIPRKKVPGNRNEFYSAYRVGRLLPYLIVRRSFSGI
jgi:hypothetical protein